MCDGKLNYAWTLLHLPEPLEHVVNRKPTRDPVRPYSRLLTADLMHAITAHSIEGAKMSELMKK